MTNKLNVLIVEDEEADCNALAAEVRANADKLCLAGVSKSSYDALAFIRNHKPHAVILDLDLTKGSGDGMDLLDKLRSSLIFPKPYIVVNTSCASRKTLDAAKRIGADYSFSKGQKGYSPKMAINQLLLVMPSILGDEEEPTAPLTEAQLDKKMKSFVREEFNKLGLYIKNKGYEYLVEAVILAAKGNNQNWARTIGAKLGKSEGSVQHSMQYALNNTWTNGNIISIQKYYTAALRKDKEVPTANEFVFYYKQKLLDYLNN